MNPESEERQQRAIEEAALRWQCERDAGFTAERARAFADWCAADPQHAAAAARAERTYALLSELPEAETELRAELDAAESRVVSFSKRRTGGWLPGLAAAAALALVVTWFVRSDGLARVQVVNAGAQPEFVALEDGSRLDMNANTELRVSLRSNERRVELTRGEAHFAVAPDPTRPFVVTAGGVSVQAVGTAFNVAMGAHGVEVVVREGRVAIRDVRVRAGPAPAEIPIVAAGERIRVEPASVAHALVVEKLGQDRIDQQLAWRHRTESFPDIALPDLVARFNQANVTQLSIEDPALVPHRMGGSFVVNDVEAFVRLLEAEGAIAATRHSDHLIGLRRAR